MLWAITIGRDHLAQHVARLLYDRTCVQRVGSCFYQSDSVAASFCQKFFLDSLDPLSDHPRSLRS